MVGEWGESEVPEVCEDEGKYVSAASRTDDLSVPLLLRRSPGNFLRLPCRLTLLVQKMESSKMVVSIFVW